MKFINSIAAAIVTVGLTGFQSVSGQMPGLEPTAPSNPANPAAPRKLPGTVQLKDWSTLPSKLENETLQHLRYLKLEGAAAEIETLKKSDDKDEQLKGAMEEGYRKLALADNADLKKLTESYIKDQISMSLDDLKSVSDEEFTTDMAKLEAQKADASDDQREMIDDEIKDFKWKRDALKAPGADIHKIIDVLYKEAIESDRTEQKIGAIVDKANMIVAQAVSKKAQDILEGIRKGQDPKPGDIPDLHIEFGGVTTTLHYSNGQWEDTTGAHGDVRDLSGTASTQSAK